jgi:hypothetical protein
MGEKRNVLKFPVRNPKRQDLSCYDPSTSVLVSKGHVVKDRH